MINAQHRTHSNPWPAAHAGPSLMTRQYTASIHNNRAKCRPSLVTIPSYIAAMVIMHVYESYAVKVETSLVMEFDHWRFHASVICVNQQGLHLELIEQSIDGI